MSTGNGFVDSEAVDYLGDGIRNVHSNSAIQKIVTFTANEVRAKRLSAALRRNTVSSQHAGPTIDRFVPEGNEHDS